tara:strand:+ start:6166 stop:6723 length:558 start_codon:yes stop_codon:yes gene_type:complete
MNNRKTLISEGLDNFITDVISAIKGGYECTLDPSISGMARGTPARRSMFFVTTVECGKVYECRGVSGMLAIVEELVQAGRKIREVRPLAQYAPRYADAEFSMDMREPIVVTPIEDPLELEVEVEDVISRLEAVKAAVEVGDFKIEPVVEDYSGLSKKELVALCKERDLSANIQETKAKLIKRLES